MSLRARHTLAVVVALGAAAGCAQHMAEPAAPGYSAPPPSGMEEPEAKPQPQPGYGQPASTLTPAPATATAEGEKKEDGLGRTESQRYTRVEDAEAELERARAQLEAFGIESRETPKTSNSQAGPSAKPADKTPSKKPAKLATASDTRCESACKALSSLKRAAEGVCRLAGDSDARCTRAREIVKDNETRVAVCNCEEKSE